MSLDVRLTCKCCNRSVFEANITHNLTGMADKAGMYKALWRPEELITWAGSGIQAKQIETPIREGLSYLKAHATECMLLSADNGWGTYEQFIPWLEEYLEALFEYPETYVTTSR